MTMRHRDLEQFALQLAPELAQSQLYVCDHPEGVPRPDVFGYTVANSPQLQAALERAGEWEGNGQFVVFADPTMSDGMRDVVLLHELSHRLPFAPSQQTAAHSAAKFAEFISSAAEPLPTNQPAFAFGDHGIEHVRIALHCWWRAALLGKFVWFAGLCAGPAYQLSPPIFYWRAIGNEPVRMQHATFTEILNTPAPDDFNQLFLTDIRRWIQSHPEVLKVSHEQEQEQCQLSQS
jgi:hypothetical protein